MVAFPAIDTVATRLVDDSTAVEFTVMPVPNAARVDPATKRTFGEPVTRTARLVAPGEPEDTAGSASVSSSSDWPTLASPVFLLTTRSAVVPAGNPPGTVTLKRRRPDAESSVTILVPIAVTGAPTTGANVTLLFAAVGSNPTPVMAIATPTDAPAGATDESEPACAICKPRPSASASARCRDSDRTRALRATFCGTVAGTSGTGYNPRGLAPRARARATMRAPAPTSRMVAGSGTGCGAGASKSMLTLVVGPV